MEENKTKQVEKNRRKKQIKEKESNEKSVNKRKLKNELLMQIECYI